MTDPVTKPSADTSVMEAARRIVAEVDAARAKGRESFVSDDAEAVARALRRR